MEFIVSVKVGFGEVFSGGVLALHKLAYELANRGHKVIIFTKPEYPHENIEIQENSDENNLNFSYDPKKTIIIPSHNWKNNVGIINVSRWILYHIENDDMENIEENDEIFNYGTFKLGKYVEEKKLTVFDYHKDIFYNYGKPRNKKYCYITNKNHPNNWLEIFETKYGADNITDWKNKGYEYLAKRLNEYEFLLTYDDKSFYSLAATMCGTKVIILKNDEQSSLSYKLKTPYNLFGVSYGWDDVEWSKQTINLVPLLVDKLEEDDKITIDNFIKFWEEKII
jgi:hypothetical protein